MSTTNPKIYESVAPRKVAFLGLGVMGLPMARLTPILESMLQRSHRAARLPA